MTTNAAYESGIPHGSAQGKSIWVLPRGMCLEEVSEGLQKLTVGHKRVSGRLKREKAWDQS